MRRRPQCPWRDLDHDERGMASMEMLLGLPFLALILVLSIDAAAVFLFRIETDVATRFAGTTYLHADEGSAGRVAAAAAVDRYYDRLDFVRLEARDRPDRDAYDGEESGWTNRFASRLSDWLAGFGRKISIDAESAVRLPVGSRLSASPVQARFVVVGGTWTYEEVPLSTSGLVDQLTELGSANSQGTSLWRRILGWLARIGGFALEGFFWLLGMYP